MATPLSSRKTRWVGSRVGAVAAHCARAAAMSGGRVRKRVSFFLRVQPSWFTARQMVVRLADVARAPCSSARVRSCSAPRASHRPWGAWSATRWPRSPRPSRRRRLVATPLSSRKTRWVGSRVGAVAAHCARAAAMSGRSCSEARIVFFTGAAQLVHGPPDGRQTGRRGEGPLQFGEGAVRVFPDQRRERVQRGGEHRPPPVPLLAWSHFAGLSSALFEPPDPGGADVVRDRGRLYAGIAIAEEALGRTWPSMYR